MTSAPPPARAPVKIRPYRAADRDAVIDLWRECRLISPNSTPERDIELGLTTPGSLILVGTLGDRLVATAMAGSDGNRGWLHRVAVHPDHRRGGIGRQIVAHAEAWLAERGAPKINLQITTDNALVQPFWERLGYAAEPRISMGKRLPPFSPLPGSAGDAPEGKLRVVRTYLAMSEPLRTNVPAPLGVKLAVLRADEISVPFYRYLYDAVGRQWLWYERRRMSDAELAAVIRHPQIDVFVMYAAGEPAGYAELDRRAMPDIELAYFGLLPQFIGRRLGPFFLHWTLDAAWRRNPNRVWVHTCNLDHPKAIAVYQRAGFVPFKQEIYFIDDPRPLL